MVDAGSKVCAKIKVIREKLLLDGEQQTNPPVSFLIIKKSPDIA
jgi:hypothetical protein